MAFWLLLDEACRATNDREATPVAYRLISRGTENASYCHQEPPATFMLPDKVIEGMKAHFGNVKIHQERGYKAKWLREVTSFQNQLRATWERAVEEIAGCGESDRPLWAVVNEAADTVLPGGQRTFAVQSSKGAQFAIK